MNQVETDSTMINGIHDPLELHQQYECAAPFPHIVLDDFLVPKLAAQISAELAECEIDHWLQDDHSEQVSKRWMNDPARLPGTTAQALRYLNSDEACRFFSVLTGIPDLRPDPTYLGGGVHVSMPGGKLGVHADFNLHPDTGMHRRVNALIFLNEDWDPAWRGQLQLWRRDLRAPEVSVDPVLNRLVVFTITDDAFHGVPEPIVCPPDRRRFSLALYYYTSDRPEEEKAPFHWASWQQVEPEESASR
jgi:Rps23 Pro-64 3,4-dihydroxylase Tpa1-like proline 4-hydroxylase